MKLGIATYPVFQDRPPCDLVVLSVSVLQVYSLFCICPLCGYCNDSMTVLLGGPVCWPLAVGFGKKLFLAKSMPSPVLTPP